MQTQWVYLIRFNWFIFNAICGRRNLVSSNCSRICTSESLPFQQPSTSTDFSAAESKGLPRGAPGRAPGPEPDSNSYWALL